MSTSGAYPSGQVGSSVERGSPAGRSEASGTSRDGANVASVLTPAAILPAVEVDSALRLVEVLTIVANPSAKSALRLTPMTKRLIRIELWIEILLGLLDQLQLVRPLSPRYENVGIANRSGRSVDRCPRVDL